MVILTYGMETALFNFSRQAINKDSVYSTALSSLMFTSLLFMSLSLLFSNQIAHVLRYDSHPEYIVWFILLITLDIVTAIPFAKLREQNKARRFATFKVANIVLNIIFNIFFIVICPKLFGKTTSGIVHFIYNPAIGVGYIFISNLIANIITFLMLLPALLKTTFAFDKILLKKMLLYSFPLLIAGLAGMINETLDRILLKYLLPKGSDALAELGIYGACYKISIIMTLFIQTFRYAAEPFFFAHAAEENPKHLYATVMKYFVIACCFIFLATLMYMDVVKYFIGPAFRVGLHIVPVLLFANLCLGIFFNLSIWYKLTGETKFGAYLSIFGAVITLGLNYILIPLYSYTGAAWTTLACYFLMMVASYIIGQKHYPIDYNLKRIVGYILFALLLFGISELLHIPSTTFRIFSNTLLLLVFVGVVYKVESGFKGLRKI